MLCPDNSYTDRNDERIAAMETAILESFIFHIMQWKSHNSTANKKNTYTSNGLGKNITTY